MALCYVTGNFLLHSDVVLDNYSGPLSIVTPFGHNANFEKVGIIDRCDYRQGKFLMFYYKTGTMGSVRRCDYRQSFHMV